MQHSKTLELYQNQSRNNSEALVVELWRDPHCSKEEDFTCDVVQQIFSPPKILDSGQLPATYPLRRLFLFQEHMELHMIGDVKRGGGLSSPAKISQFRVQQSRWHGDVCITKVLTTP